MLAIYCRTSKNKAEGTDYSIETQQQGGILLANQLGEEYKLYIDEGISGTLDIEVRPAFAELMSDIKKKKVTAVYCIDQSRIERNTDTWRFFVGECINVGCKFFPNGIELDLKNTDNLFFANLLSLVNSYYAAITSKKVKLANDNKAKVGKTHGLKPYGYDRDENNDYVINEKEAKQVRRFFELSLEGVGTYTIANLLNKEGVPTRFNQFKGKIRRTDKYTKNEKYFEKSNVKWRGNVILDMLRNPIYKGVRVWNKNDLDRRLDVDIKVAIISPELWDNVNNNLPSNKKNVGKKAEYHYLLNGLTFCAHCGNEVVGKKRLKGHDNAYKCKGKSQTLKNCPESRGLSLPKLENFIIKHLFESKELKRLLLEAPKNGTESTQLKKKLSGKLTDKEHLTKSIERIFELLTDPLLKEDSDLRKNYIANKDKMILLDRNIEDLRARITEVENQGRKKRIKSLLESYTSDIGFDELKKLIHSLIERIEIYHGKANGSGYFLIKIIYKQYKDISMFSTNHMAMKWNWETYYRSIAITEGDKQQDTELLKTHLKMKGNKKVIIPKGFSGFETVTGMYSSITLSKDELVVFD